MTDSTTPFDAAPYLTTAEAAAAFITEAPPQKRRNRLLNA